MYTEHSLKDSLLFTRAFLSNQLARCAPALYMKLTNQTGRGQAPTEPSQVATYFLSCLTDYLSRLAVPAEDRETFLRGKRVLEYGPGDILGVALLLYAHGAESVHCVDRFPLKTVSGDTTEVYRILLRSLGREQRARADAAFREPGRPESGFDPNAIAYFVTPDGLIRHQRQYDLIISRAVLEHVNDLEATIFDIRDALKPGGIAIHEVDLKSHGLDRYQTFDFLTWPELLYKLMYSHKGFPNRWRIDKYRSLIKDSGLRCTTLVPTGRITALEIDRIKVHLAKQFQHLSHEELSWLGFWVVLENV